MEKKNKFNIKEMKEEENILVHGFFGRNYENFISLIPETKKGYKIPMPKKLEKYLLNQYNEFNKRCFFEDITKNQLIRFTYKKEGKIHIISIQQDSKKYDKKLGKLIVEGKMKRAKGNYIRYIENKNGEIREKYRNPYNINSIKWIFEEK